MEPPATCALDQLSGLVGNIRQIVGTHHTALVAYGIPTDTAGEMAVELHTALVELLLVREDDE